MERYSLQSFAEIFAHQSGLSQLAAEQLSKTFFDTILEGLNADGMVKINGLGTFKVVDVAPRESVNVNNGERILIAGYKKVNFIPDESTFTEIPSDEAIAILEQQMENLSEEEEPAASAEDTPVAVKNEGIQLDTPDLENVEQPQNEFAAIDLLISTPESLDELRTQYEVAKQRAAETLKAANEANSEMCRLERLIAHMEANTPPPAAVKTLSVVEEAPVETEPERSAEVTVQEEKPVVAAPRQEPPASEPEAAPRKQRSWLWWLLIPIVALLLAEVIILFNKYNQTATPTEQVVKPVPAKPAQKVDTLSQAQQPDTTKASSQPMRTYTLKPGDSLTKIAQRVYGSKDSVRIILRANKIPNPDNVPVGAVINLP